jgi:hypothetical protein
VNFTNRLFPALFIGNHQQNSFFDIYQENYSKKKRKKAKKYDDLSFLQI